MYNHNKAQQSKNRVHISWDILYVWAQEWNGQDCLATREMVNEISIVTNFQQDLTSK